MATASPSGSMSLREFVELYVTQIEVTRKYIWQLQITARLLCDFAAREVTVEELNDDLLNHWLTSLRETKSPTTILNKRRMILTLWKAACRMGLTAVEPVRVQRIEQPRPAFYSYTTDDYVKLLQACDLELGYFSATGVERRWYWRSYIMTAWDTGLRRSDLLQLEYHRISRDGCFTFVQSKTGTFHRCRFQPETLAEIDQGFPPERQFVWPEWCCESQWSNSFRRIAERAGLPGSSKWLRSAHVAKAGAA